jgi:hypothetical protein
MTTIAYIILVAGFIPLAIFCCLGDLSGRR